MTSHAAALFFDDLNTMRFEPPTNVNALPDGPVGSGAMPMFLRAVSFHFLSSERPAELSTHGPPIQTANLPALNMSSTAWPSFSSALVSYTPSLMRSA
jgi:hypothetical protein